MIDKGIYMQEIRRKDMSRKILSILLSLLMLASLMPVSAFADSDASAVTLTGADGTQTVLAETKTGTNYSYDADTKTLTLDNWSGRAIASNGDFNLKLVGENTVTMTDADGNLSGIYAGTSSELGEINISADAEAVLNVKASGFTQASKIYGISGTTYLNGNVTLNIDLTGMDTETRGTYGGVYYGGSNNKLNINVEADYRFTVYGLSNGGLIARSGTGVMSGNSANISAKNLNSAATAIAVDGLSIGGGAVDLTVSADNNGGDQLKRIAIDGIQYFAEWSSGTIRVNGGVVKTHYSTIKNFDKTLCATTPEGDNYWWKTASNTWEQRNYRYAAGSDGRLLESMVFTANTGDTTPKWTAGEHIFVPESKVGESIGSVDLRDGIRGLSRNGALSAEIISGSLPEGVKLWADTCQIGGTPTAPCAAGSIVVRCTDKVNNKFVDFTVKYGAVTTVRPVTALALSQNAWTPNKGDTLTVTASVTPEDASYAKLSVISGDSRIVSVDSIGAPSADGKTQIVLTARSAGKATITVESLDTHVKQTISVMVKNDKPTPTINFTNEEIRNLYPLGTYNISVDGAAAVEITANDYGIIAIPETWMGKTLTIVRTGNGVESDPVTLVIPARPAAPSGLSSTNAYSASSWDGIITGADSTMVYRVKGTTGSASAASADMTSMKAGTYEF